MDYKIAEQVFQEAVNDLHTLRDFIRWTACSFEKANLSFGHGTDNAWDEAVTLILDSLKMPNTTDSSLFDCRLTGTEKQQIVDNIEQRVNQRKPLAYITSRAWFAGHEFYVDERVLVPRSPIAELIENKFAPWLLHTPETILDLCTGGGCIAIACAMAYPDAQVDGSDLSEDALAVAQLNKEKFGLDNRCGFIQSNLFDNLHGKKYDLIISNPPYVDAVDMAMLPDEYHFEPEIGLASGQDGLDITRKILQQAAEHLTDTGILIVEVGNSAPALEEAFPDFPFTWIDFERGGDGVFMLEKMQLLSS
ncbi:MAG: 50S ribosomal protein L3 N(5)-glutamine methyltransferase [Gammaproteobacteria bacterium]|nr:MAG: 50S ribosomal protein L3 N(5)-glutamine methyltransferase [Gammaproteobacteria bacterium]